MESKYNNRLWRGHYETTYLSLRDCEMLEFLLSELVVKLNVRYGRYN